MGTHYPDQVGGHKPCEPVVVMVPCPRLGPFMFCHDGGRWMSRVDIGATQDLTQRGVGRSGRESVMAVGRFCQNAVGPPKWECEAMGSVVWVPCANLCRVCMLNLWIAAPTDKGPVHSRSHYGSTGIVIMCLITTLVR